MKRYVRYIPFIIIALASVLGLIKGLIIPISKGSSNNIWGLMSTYYFMKELNTIGVDWWYIAKHNISYSILHGILGLLSGGVMATKFLYNSWLLWTQVFKMYTDVPTRIFIVLEAIGMTGMVVSIMSLGYRLVTKNRQYVKQLIALAICILFLFLGAVLEQHVI